MMNEMQIFNNAEFGEVRVIERDGEPWFVGKDVAEILGYSNGRDALSRHVETEDKADVGIHDGSQMRQMAIINESGLYSLILSSKLPNAKKFKHWVTSEVLPSVRKHGVYMTSEVLEQMLLTPDTIIKIATALKDEQEKRKALEIANSALIVDKQIMQPKADYFDDLVDRNLNTGIRETAKEYGIGQNALVGFLMEHKYIYRDKKGKLQPYAAALSDGLFVLKECFNEKTSWAGTQLLITPKGREIFRLLCVGA